MDKIDHKCSSLAYVKWTSLTQSIRCGALKNLDDLFVELSMRYGARVFESFALI